jgi:hypothetical protein
MRATGIGGGIDAFTGLARRFGLGGSGGGRITGGGIVGWRTGGRWR